MTQDGCLTRYTTIIALAVIGVKFYIVVNTFRKSQQGIDELL